MIQCHKCKAFIWLSEESNRMIKRPDPIEHIVRCPNCGDETQVVMASYVEKGEFGFPVSKLDVRGVDSNDSLQIVDGLHPKV